LQVFYSFFAFLPSTGAFNAAFTVVKRVNAFKRAIVVKRAFTAVRNSRVAFRVARVRTQATARFSKAIIVRLF